MNAPNPLCELRRTTAVALAAIVLAVCVRPQRAVAFDAAEASGTAGGSPAIHAVLGGAPPEPEDVPGGQENRQGLPPEPPERSVPERDEPPPPVNEGPPDGAPPEPEEAPAAEPQQPDSDEEQAAETPRESADEADDEPQEAAEPAEPEPVVLRQFLILRQVDQFRRTPFQQDAVEAAMVSGDWQPPSEGDDLEGSTGTRRLWQAAQADDDGWLRDAALRGGYAYATYDSPREQVVLLHARGHSMVYVNGIPRAGDAYDNGWLRLPIQLREGTNEFLFHVGRSEIFAELEEPVRPALLDQSDATLPDLIVGEAEAKWAAVWVINASAEPLSGAKIVCRVHGDSTHETGVVQVPPLSVRKVPFQIDGSADAMTETAQRTVQLVQSVGDQPQVLDEVSLELSVIEPTEPHERTFVSDIDGSVQYYAVQPRSAAGSESAGMILSLHGASIDAAAHASQYASKPWAHVVAPTNRRPYGFDWEDWGRLDALEALSDAQERYEVDPRRIFLTGHAMGGHGAWHLGSTYPGRFAAVAPSAGWISFDTYTSAGAAAETPIARIMRRAANPSQTLALTSNLKPAGVYVLHGSDDENVPVGEARRMRAELAEFHPDFAYYERPGAGHWWGSESLDWPPMMEFFQHHEVPEAKDVARVDFTTMNPGVSARSGWLTIEAQETQLTPSTAAIECDRENREFIGTTSNVARLALDVSHLEPGSSIRIELDGQRLRDVRWPSVTRTVWLEKDGPRWSTTDPPSPNLKGPHRYGLFKDVFRNRPVLVYGTRGNDEEDRWAFAKARFDAETFLYRGNGTLEVVADVDFNPTEYEDRNVVLYGNADTNRAWPALLSTCPIQVRRGTVRVGLRAELGDDLACLFIYPRQGTARASVGVVSGTGLVGMHLTSRLRYFVSGVAYPDLVIFDPSVLHEGDAAIRAAGFFGLDWQLESGDIAWRDLAL